MAATLRRRSSSVVMVGKSHEEVKHIAERNGSREGHGRKDHQRKDEKPCVDARSAGPEEIGGATVAIK